MFVTADGDTRGSNVALKTPRGFMVRDANAGVLVTSGERSDWFPPTTSQHYVIVHGIGERAYTDYTDGLGYEATAPSSKGVTSVQLSGKGNASTALSLLRIAIDR